MYGLNAVALVFFGCINVLAYRLCKCEKGKRKKVIFALCAALLSCNLLRYYIVCPLIKGMFIPPVEFSTVAYFAVPAVLLMSKQKLYSWAAYSGLMAGFFYYIAMIVAGGQIYGNEPPADIYLSMFCHGTIYLCGFVTIATEVLNKSDAPKLALGVALVAVRAAVLRPFVTGGNRLLIYILLDAAVIRQLFPQNVWAFALPAYYIGIAVFVLLTIRGFYRKNQKQYRKFFCGVTVKTEVSKV